jgi:hypothetical protein
LDGSVIKGAVEGEAVGEGTVGEENVSEGAVVEGAAVERVGAEGPEKNRVVGERLFLRGLFCYTCAVFVEGDVER